LPGRVESIRDPCFLIISLARFAASLALEASVALVMIFLATAGFSSKKIFNFSFIKDSTRPLTSLFPSFVFV